MDVQRIMLEIKVARLGRSINSSKAATLRDVVVVSMRPRAILPAFMITRTAIHRFLFVQFSAWQPIASLSFFMAEAVPMTKFYLRKDPALVYPVAVS